MKSYIFGAGTGIASPEELKRRRTVAEALAERAGDTSPTTLAGGLGRVAQGLMARYARNKADAEEKKGRDSANEGFSKVMQKLMGGKASPGMSAAPTSAPALTGDLAQTEAYIRKAAEARGIDPDIAVRVARSEGLAPGVYQSNIVKNGVREPSYGPFQLYTGGGLGNEFQKATGLDPRDPSTVQQQIDFALDAAKRGGWSPWYGAKKVGVGDWDGINRGQPQPAGGQAPAMEPPPRTPINIVDDQGILAPSQSVAPSQGMPPQPPQQQGATAVPQGMEQAVSEVSALPIEEVVHLLSNPYLNDAQRSVVQFVFERAMNPPDPMEAQMKQLQLQKLQQEVAGAGQPKAQPRPATQQEKAAYGVEPNAPLFFEADGTPKMLSGGGVTVNNNMPGGGKFEEAFAKGDADTIGTVYNSGLAAQRNIGRIDQLESLLNASPSGADAALRQAAGEWGINTEGLDTIQAAQALINSLVPEQRQPGSGPMSDADLALFKQSLPRIINQPGGNQMVIQTMRAIAQYDAEGARIVQQLRSGQIDRSQAFEMLQNRENPLARMAAPPAGAPAPQAPAAQPGAVFRWTPDGGLQ